MPAIFVIGSRPAGGAIETLQPLNLEDLKFEVSSEGSYVFFA